MSHAEQLVRGAKRTGTKILRLEIAKSDIVAAFRNSGRKIFTLSDVGNLFAENRAAWRVTQTTKLDEFIEFTLKHGIVNRSEFTFPTRKEVRFTMAEPSIFAVVQSLRMNAYFSHYTAVHLHQLTEQLPKAIYLNSEQTPKPKPKGGLEQERIDFAFKNRQRTTRMIAPYGEHAVHLLSGKFTNQLGVTDFSLGQGQSVRVTGIERTLIDITVRPAYSGGVFEVAKAFRLAKGKFSINKLGAILRQLDYVYPYHQALGYYLDHAGVYDSASLEPLRKFGLNYDFYLTHQMKEQEYSKEWRLYYPKGF